MRPFIATGIGHAVYYATMIAIEGSVRDENRWRTMQDAIPPAVRWRAPNNGVLNATRAATSRSLSIQEDYSWSRDLDEPK